MQKKLRPTFLKDIALSEELYRIGITKVFFKAGVLGQLEDMRDEALAKILAKLQASVTTNISYKFFNFFNGFVFFFQF